MKFRNRFTALILALVMVFSLTVSASAATAQTVTVKLSPNITVTLDGEAQAMTDVNGNPVYPVLYGGTTYLPVRAVGNMLGLDVGWNQATQTVLLTTASNAKPATSGGKAPANAKPSDITVTINPTIRVKLDGETQKMTNVNGDPVYPMLYGGTTYLPVRAVSNMMDLKVDWDQATQTVLLSTKRPMNIFIFTDKNGNEVTVDFRDAETARKQLTALGWADEFIERGINGPRDSRSMRRLLDDVDRAINGGDPYYTDTHDHTRIYTAPDGRKVTFDAADPDWSRDVFAAVGFSQDEINQIMLDMTGRKYGGQTSADATVLGGKHIGNDWAEIDWSTASNGYVRIRVDEDIAAYTDCHIACHAAYRDEDGYHDYQSIWDKDLDDINDWWKIPLLGIEQEFECVIAINYVAGFNDKLQARFTAQIDDLDSMWLMSNAYIDYENAPDACAKAKELTRNCKTEAEKIAAIYNFVSKAITYNHNENEADRDLNPDHILASGKGVCEHYAVLMTAMLRSIGIPCKCANGNVNFDGEWNNHAWVVVKPETGTLNIPGMGKDYARSDLNEDGNSVPANPTGWIRLDPTNAHVPNKTSNDNIYNTFGYR